MDPILWMKKSWERYKHKTVKLVHCPVPPTPVDNLVFMPSAWNNKVLDCSFDRKSGLNCVTSVITRMGPTILIYVKLGDLLEYDHTGVLSTIYSTCCGGVSFNTLFRSDDGLTYVDDVVLDSLQTVHRSCHPGSHYAIPGAPHITALLQWEHARGHKKKIHEYLTPEEAELAFPACDFSSNVEIDRYISTCVVPDTVFYHDVSDGLGLWSAEYLRSMRRNLVLMEDADYVEWGFKLSDEGSGDSGEEDVRPVGQDSQRGGVVPTLQAQG